MCVGAERFQCKMFSLCEGSSESIRFYNKLVCSTRRWFHVVVFGCPAMRTWTVCRWNNTIRLSCNEIWPFHRRNSQRRSCPGRTFQSQDPDSNPLKEEICQLRNTIDQLYLHDFFTGTCLEMMDRMKGVQKVLMASVKRLPQYFVGAASLTASLISSGESALFTSCVINRINSTLIPFEKVNWADLLWKCIWMEKREKISTINSIHCC